MRPALLALFTLPLTACFGGCPGPESQPDPEQECVEGNAPETDGAIELVDEEGTPLADSASIPLNQGSQGGEHIYVNLKVFPTTMPDAFIEASFESEDGEAYGNTQVFLDDGCDGWQLRTNELLQLWGVVAGGVPGTLRVSLGYCDGPCSTDAEGLFTNFVSIAEDEVPISVVK
ncbi:MAG: hypothetical protein HOW73_42390 [Polyangiaceae bacterium]|nr:hypothetical protein [Polyangiaceae bacterium]